ncbi:hypothetical protein SAMN04515620_1117 [Collimonas sp. OK607]|nr:hypothetical protein SAMN04515620_1117 [Collimonas sp. OK607]
MLLIVLDPVISIAAVGILPPNGVAGPYSTWFPSGQTGIGIIPPPVTATAAAGTADVAATVGTNVAVRTATGIAIDVPVTAVATVSGDAIAARGAAMAIPGVGTAIAVAATAVQVAQMLKDAGFRYGNCANPGLIVGPSSSYCMPNNNGLYLYTVGGLNTNFSSALDAATARSAQICQQNGVTSGYYCPVPSGSCTEASGAGSWSCVTSGNYTSVTGSKIVNPNPPAQTYSSASGDAIAGALKLRMIADSNARKALFDAMRADATGTVQPDSLPPLYPATSPVTVTAPPVTSAPSSPSVQTIPKPDGSIDTVKTTEQTTVTPTTTGTTVGDTKTTFPSSTTTTTTTTNNVSNTTTTSTNVVSNPPALPMFPNDYNKEVTQQKIERDLNTDAAGAPPDLTTVTTGIASAQQDQSTDFTNIPTQLATDKANWFSWVWTPPVGSCVPSTATLNGVAVSLDYCPTVLKIRDVMGFLFAMFGAWQIYSLIFREN